MDEPTWGDVALVIANGTQRPIHTRAFAKAMDLLTEMATLLDYHRDQERTGTEYGTGISHAVPEAFASLDATVANHE